MTSGLDMDAASHPGPSAGSARLLLALRHALADPLSTAALKLDLVERRLGAPGGADPAWVVERVRAAQAEVTTATRLLDLLRRLAEIAEEEPEETTLADVCRTAGVPLAGGAPQLPPLALRRRASSEAVLGAASFLWRGGGGDSPVARPGTAGDWVTLEIEGPRATPDGRPGRLLDLPHGDEDAEALFLARAAAEADGGRLELTERGGSLIVLFAWPAAPQRGGA